MVNQARASGIPVTKLLNYSGILTDPDGKPLTGTVNIQIRLWDNEAAGNAQCDIGPIIQTLKAGTFQISLPDSCVTAVQKYPDLWVEPIVNGSSLGRSKLGVVPFALEANHATVADAASTAAGPLKSTVEGLVNRGVRVVRAEDNRPGCPPAGAVGADLIALDLKLTKDTPVHISGDMIRVYDGRADIMLIVDGAGKFIGLTQSATLVWAPAHLEWTGTLAAGDHKISIRNGQDPGGCGGTGCSAAGIWGCGPAHGALTAIIYE